jgi:uncharacterized protein (DUF1330 family)
MAAYLIVDVEAVDAEQYRQYSERANPTLERYGGKIIVRGGRFEAPEGGWQPRRLLLVEFPDYATAQAWYQSPEYQATIPIRQGSARTGAFLIVDGA